MSTPDTWPKSDTDPCLSAGEHRAAQRHPRAECPAPDLPLDVLTVIERTRAQITERATTTAPGVLEAEALAALVTLMRVDPARAESVVRLATSFRPPRPYRSVAHAAGLDMFEGVLDVLHNRETIPPEALVSITSSDVIDWYDQYVSPAIDAIEKELIAGE